MSGHVSFDMQRAMYDHITRMVTPDTKDALSTIGKERSAAKMSQSTAFQRHAALVAVGLHADVAQSVEYRALIHQLSNLSTLSDKQSTPLDSSFKSKLHNLVTADIDQVGKLKPIKPLGHMLTEAYELDRTWKDDKFRGPLDDLLAQAIDIPIQTTFNELFTNLNSLRDHRPNRSWRPRNHR